MPRLFRKDTRASAARIRAIDHPIDRNAHGTDHAGTAPEDLATKIMTTADPETGAQFDDRGNG